MTDQELNAKLDLLAGLMTAVEEKKAAFEESIKNTTEAIADLQAAVKAEVLARGESAKTDHITAIWNNGKTSWNSKLLEGYALAHPDILAAKKVGDPTVSFRLVK